MSFSERFARWHRRVLADNLDRRFLHGVGVGVFVTDHSTDAILNKLGRGIWLLQRYSPRDFGELRRHCRLVIVFGWAGAQAQWWTDVKWIWFNAARFVEGHFTAEMVAATLVHELAHARLHAAGFEYTSDRRRRMEAICLRAQERFCRRLPGGSGLADFYRQWADDTLMQPDAEWSNEAFRIKEIDRLKELGLPEWLARLSAYRRRSEAV